MAFDLVGDGHGSHLLELEQTMIHYLDKKSKNGRVCVAPCGFVAPMETTSEYSVRQPQTFTSSEMGVTCSLCVSALVARHQSAIIILQSQNFDDYVRRSRDPMTISIKEMLG